MGLWRARCSPLLYLEGRRWQCASQTCQMSTETLSLETLALLPTLFGAWLFGMKNLRVAMYLSTSGGREGSPGSPQRRGASRCKSKGGGCPRSPRTICAARRWTSSSAPSLQKVAVYVNLRASTEKQIWRGSSVQRFIAFHTVHCNTELGTFGIFDSFNNKKWFFAFFIKLTRLGVGYLNKTGADIGY